MATSARKFRPYFTLAELRIIRDRLSIDDIDAVGIHRYLDGFIAEVEFGIRRAAHTTKGRTTMVESLGMEQELSDQYRYEHDLMTPEEEKEYEIKMGAPNF